MVRILEACFSLIRSISEAMVVDFPAPVIPVTRTSPCFRSRMSSQILLGKPIDSTLGIFRDRRG